jgi:hypothetical protein
MVSTEHPKWIFPIMDDEEGDDKDEDLVASQPCNSDQDARIFFQYSQALNTFLIWIGERFPSVKRAGQVTVFKCVFISLVLYVLCRCSFVCDILILH